MLFLPNGWQPPERPNEKAIESQLKSGPFAGGSPSLATAATL
jgi:hypothetical protein